LDGRLRTLLALLPTLECQMMHQEILKLIVRTLMKDRAAFDMQKAICSFGREVDGEEVAVARTAPRRR
jgi:hypothetical protein